MSGESAGSKDAAAAPALPAVSDLQLLQAIEEGRAKDVKHHVEVLNAKLDGPPLELLSSDDVPPPQLGSEGLQLCIPKSVTYISPLNWAVFHGRFPTLKYLVEQGGANIDGCSDDGRRPLHIGVSRNNAEIIQWLVEKAKCDVDAVNFAGETPLYHSVYFKLPAVSKYLLEQGANPAIVTLHKFNTLHMAASRGQHEILEKICEAAPQCVSAAALDGTTPLHLAALAGDPESIKILLAHHADPTALNLKGEPALELAASQSEPRHAAAALLLLDKTGTKGLPEIAITRALHAAAMAGRGEVVAALARHGGNLNARGPQGQCPIHTAAFNGHMRVVEILAEAGADLTVEDEDGENAAFHADMGGHDGIVAFLKRKGVEYDD